MATDVTRRAFLGAAAVAGTAGSAALAADAGASNVIRILAISTSPRKGKTTAVALQAALDEAKKVAPNIEVELIELAGLKINGDLAAGIPLAPGERDDFPSVQEKMADPRVGGIIVGSPTYFGQMSSLCKAFLDRWMAFRKNLSLRNRVGGVLAVGAARNGGQELVLHGIQTVMFSMDMLLVGDGRPTAHRGATLWNNAKDDIAQDEWGMSTARNLGRRVAEVALWMTHARTS